MKIIYSAKSITGLKKTKGESGLSMHALFTATLPLSETPECFESGKDMNWGRVWKVARYRNKVTKLEPQVCLSWSCLFSLAAVVLYAFYMYLCNVWYVCVYIHIHRYSILIYYWINYWLKKHYGVSAFICSGGMPWSPSGNPVSPKLFSRWVCLFNK